MKQQPRFVVQEHHATRLHWDFRLEREGVLKSWAIPKQPPRVSGIRRLAFQVEDHGLDYADFEGTIPDDEYGAGLVKIWDRGVYIGRLTTREKYEVVLRGQKLRGTYVLFRFPKAGKNAWLFFKTRGKTARVKGSRQWTREKRRARSCRAKS